MSDISRLDLMRMSGQVIQKGLQVWGLTQEQRRASQYQSALTAAREEYHALLTKIQQTPFEFRDDGTNVYQEMFEGEVDKIYGRLAKEFLNDPYVKNQFDLQWGNATQGAREAAMDFAWRTEKVATTVRGYKNLDDTFHLGFDASHSQANEIITSLHQAGVIDAQGREEMWSYWRQKGGQKLEERLGSAVAMRDSAAVDKLIDLAVSNTIIRDPEVAAGRRATAHRDILFGTYQDYAQALLQAEGEEAAIKWAYDRNSMPELSWEEQNKIIDEMEGRVSWQRQEEKRNREIVNDQYSEQADALEKRMQAGEATWAEGLKWLREDSTVSAMDRGLREHLYDRWTLLEEREVNGEPATSDDNAKNIAFADFVDRIIRGEEHDSIRDAALKLMRDGLFSRTDFEAVLKWSDEREQFGDFWAKQVEAMIRDEAAKKNRTLTEYDINQIRGGLYTNLSALRYAPDGQAYNNNEVEANIRKTVVNMLDPTRLKSVQSEAVLLESLQPGGIFTGGISRQFMLGDISREEDVLTQLVEGRAYGIVDIPKTTDLVRLAMTEGVTSLQEATIRGRLLDGRDEAYLTENQKRVLDANVQTAKLAVGHLNAYRSQFGTIDDPRSVVILPDGTLAFKHQESGWSEPRLVRLQTATDLPTAVTGERGRDEQWYFYRNGAWVRSDTMNTRRDRTATPAPEPGPTPAPDSRPRQDPEVVARREAAAGGVVETLQGAATAVTQAAETGGAAGVAALIVDAARGRDPNVVPEGFVVVDGRHVQVEKAGHAEFFVPRLEQALDAAAPAERWDIEKMIAQFSDPGVTLTQYRLDQMTELLERYGLGGNQ